MGPLPFDPNVTRRGAFSPMTFETAARPAKAADPAPDRPLDPLPELWTSVARAFVHRARSQPERPAMVDSTGAALTYGQTLVRASALARVLSRRLGEGPFVGLLLPPTVPSAVANIALTLLGKVPVNLNYTAGQAVIDASVTQCGLTQVITSPRAIDRFKLQPKAELVMLEDLKDQVGALDKVWAAVVAKVVPIGMLGRFLPGLKADDRSHMATVIFTSGSTGDPKGVILSHGNVLSNIHQIDRAVRLSNDDVVLCFLPFFHSFGFTVALWTVLCLGLKAVYHFNPLDARTIGELAEKHDATILFGSPTFMRGYVQRCEPRQFATLRLTILGAEKLKPELARDAKEKLGVVLLEGYGCTETGPVAAVNIPETNRPGTVGRPLPGTAIKTADPETGADLPRGTEGIIHVKGPQVMVGYLNRPEATAAVLKDGWYSTGDIGLLDDDGYLKITDRYSRFSKVGGEMVPHLAVEAAIVEACGVDESKVAVTALPDPKRGERLAVIHTDLGIAPAEVVKRLGAGPLPKLWLPSPEDFVAVEAVPVLGTGKIDLRGLKEIAKERLGT